jgi:hypothetical protein
VKDERFFRTAGLAARALLLAAAAPPVDALAQVADTTLAQQGIYDRPFVASVSAASVGGYLEGNTNWFVEEGVSEGFSMELRRFNVFLFSQISPRIRFLSELEFEHGTEEIALETALVDIQIRPELVIRAGIILPPLGFFNQNHDSPKWDFVERPLVSTELIPSTLSEVGAGLYGRLVWGGLLLSYDAYVTNGLGDAIVGSELGRTAIPAGKSEERFGEDNNGSPAVTARLAARRPTLGEVGFSYYGGYYNSWQREGLEVDEPRWLGISALDVGMVVRGVEARSELAVATIDVPPALAELFGKRQWGGHVDVLVPLWRPRIASYPSAALFVGLRIEHVDFNVGTFAATGGSIGDEVTAIVPAISVRPGARTVFRANYRYEWVIDFAGNEPIRRAGFQFGIATYF